VTAGQFTNTIYKTTDGGVSLVAETLPIGGVSGVATVAGDANDAWGVGPNGIVHTADGGATWTQQTVPAGITSQPSGQEEGIHFSDALHGWAANGYYQTATGAPVVLRTVDGGQTWSAVVIGGTACPPTQGNYFRLSFTDPDHGWVAGLISASLATTTDGGVTWNSRSCNDPLYSFAFGDAAHGWTIGETSSGGPGIWATSDGGGSWQSQTPPPGLAYPFNVEAIDASHAWVAGDGIAYTTGGGTTWSVGAVQPLDGGAWGQQRGAATDIAVDGGQTFALGTGAALGGHPLWQEGNSGWSAFAGGGAGTVVAVDPGGNPWVVNDRHEIWHWSGAAWEQEPGSGNYVAAGADGSVYAIGTNAVSGGWTVWRWNGTRWDSVSGGLVDLSIGTDGSVWGVNSARQVWHMDSTHPWNQLPGLADDVAAFDYNWAWATGTNAQPGGNGLWLWTGQAWRSEAGAAVDLAVDTRTSLPWAVNDGGAIYSRD
jgi:hypothetical protein